MECERCALNEELVDLLSGFSSKRGASDIADEILAQHSVKRSRRPHLKKLIVGGIQKYMRVEGKEIIDSMYKKATPTTEANDA